MRVLPRPPVAPRVVVLAALLATHAAAPGHPSSTRVAVNADFDGAAPAAVEVLVAGEPRQVLGVDPVAASAWQVLVYLDAPLATPEGVHRALRLLADRADLLVGLGPVELVAADPLPRTLLAPTGDPETLRRALAGAVDECVSTGELLWLRQRYSASPADAPAARSEAETAETELTLRQNQALLHWLQRGPAGGQRLLVLVRDGYDLRAGDFYRGDDPPPPDPLALAPHVELERRVAAAGWTTMALDLGDRHEELGGVREALGRLAEATGGEVVGGAKALRRTLERLEARHRVVFAALPGDGAEPSPLLVRARGRRRAAAAVRWLGAAPEAGPGPPGAAADSEPGRSVVRLLVPGERPARGVVDLHTIVTTRAVERVEFSVDGEPAGAATRHPFSTRVDLGPDARPRRVTAVAYGPGGRRLGHDWLVLNRPGLPPGVRLTRLAPDPRGVLVEIAAEVVAPSETRVESVEFYWNESHLATLEKPPYEVEAPVGAPGAGDYARVVARLADGSRLEGARLAPTAGAGDRVDVNLVEVYALVTDRRGEPRRDLDRDDFLLLRRGRRQSIEGFAPAVDLPLHLGLLIDTSESMRRHMPEVRAAAARFLERVLGPRDRAFLVDFASRPRLLQSPTSDLESLLRRLGGLQPHGDTVLYDSVLFSLRQFEGVGGRRALVVLTDGVDEGSRFGSKLCIRRAREAGVPIYLIRIGDAAQRGTGPLAMINRQLAHHTGGRLHTLPRGEGLDAAYQHIEDELRSHYLLTFSTDRGLSDDQRREIEVEVADPKLSVRTIVGARSRG
ncbi:MAG: VWA domain-containing protein [Thermoanaerobaculia bacterium]|nr:VWA domain-containing protein [Thermoanaerobaculia bacterium]